MAITAMVRAIKLDYNNYLQLLLLHQLLQQENMQYDRTYLDYNKNMNIWFHVLQELHVGEDID